MHSAMFWSTETGDYCRHVQTCMKQDVNVRKKAMKSIKGQQISHTIIPNKDMIPKVIKHN